MKGVYIPMDESGEDHFPASSPPVLQGRPQSAQQYGYPHNPTDRQMAARVSLDNAEGMRVWKDVSNFDRFLEQLYAYYHGKGYGVILINRVTNLLTYGFVAVFALFLRYCIDWALLLKLASAAEHPKLWDVVKLRRIFGMSFFMYVFTVSFGLVWCWQLWLLSVDKKTYRDMKMFFNRVLLIDDEDLVNYDFNEIVNKLAVLHSAYPKISGKLDAMDVANRIMRKENYLVALYNKDVVDLSLPLPFCKSQTLTNTLEWNLSFAVVTYIFDENLAVRRSFSKEANRAALAEGLKRRFQQLAIVNLVLSPFILLFLLFHYIFRNGEEFYRNPKLIGNRQYTPYARWKLREFNELPHIFEERVQLSHRKAIRYMEQFHSPRLAGIGKFVSFLAGSFCAVMIALAILNEDLLLHFEITAGKSMIWYLAVLGGVLAITRSFIPDPSTSRDPVRLMESVAEHTHYMPSHWKHKLRTRMVREEFGDLYQYQLMLFVRECLSIISTPFVLWFTLPGRAEKIVEFFREFTVHVDGLGYVCSFAIFNFQRHGDPDYGGGVGRPSAQPAPAQYFQSKQGKMEKSFINFASKYPDWVPNEQGSMYISRLKDFEIHQSMTGSRAFKPRTGRLFKPKHDMEEEEEGLVEENPGIMALLNEYYEYRQQGNVA